MGPGNAWESNNTNSESEALVVSKPDTFVTATIFDLERKHCRCLVPGTGLAGGSVPSLPQYRAAIIRQGAKATNPHWFSYTCPTENGGCGFKENIPSFEDTTDDSPPRTSSGKFSLRCNCVDFATNTVNYLSRRVLTYSNLRGNQGRHFYSCDRCKFYLFEDSLPRLYSYHDTPFLTDAALLDVPLALRPAKPPVKGKYVAQSSSSHSHSHSHSGSGSGSGPEPSTAPRQSRAREAPGAPRKKKARKGDRDSRERDPADLSDGSWHGSDDDEEFSVGELTQEDMLKNLASTERSLSISPKKPVVRKTRKRKSKGKGKTKKSKEADFTVDDYDALIEAGVDSSKINIPSFFGSPSKSHHAVPSLSLSVVPDSSAAPDLFSPRGVSSRSNSIAIPPSAVVEPLKPMDVEDALQESVKLVIEGSAKGKSFARKDSRSRATADREIVRVGTARATRSAVKGKPKNKSKAKAKTKAKTKSKGKGKEKGKGIKRKREESEDEEEQAEPSISNMTIEGLL